MTAPRPVFPGSFLLVTRNTTQQQFLLRPDDETTSMWAYCLADAARRTGVEVLLTQIEANHHHTILWDPDGRQVEFREHLHKTMAKTQNARLGRRENLWAAEEPSVVTLMELSDVIDKLVYVATNPVKDNLVERVQDWPGLKFFNALLRGTPIKVKRPRHFFSRTGEMPEELELELKLPDHIEGKAALMEELRRRVAEVEASHAQKRMRSGARVLGRARVLRQAWIASPTPRRLGRTMNPLIAAKDPVVRILALQRIAEWRQQYRAAREQLVAGSRMTFPYGTYWLRRFAGVAVAEPNAFN